MKIVIDGREFNGQSNVAEWYDFAYPGDNWGRDVINRGITFQDVFECLDNKANIYAFLGGVDSVIRERVFDALATMMEVNYDVVYYQWLKSSNGARQLHKDLKKLRFR